MVNRIANSGQSGGTFQCFPCGNVSYRSILQKLGPILTGYNKALKAIKGSASLLSSVVVPLPASVFNTLKALKAPMLLTLPATLQGLVKNVRKSLHHERSSKKRIMSVMKAISDCYAIGASIAIAFELMRMLRYVTARAVSWIPLLNFPGVIVNTISAAFSMSSLVRAFATLRTLRSTTQRLQNTTLLQEKQEIISQFFSSLQEGSRFKKITKQLKIQAKDQLPQRIESLAVRVFQGNTGAIQEAEALIAHLKSRAHHIVDIAKINTVTRVSDLALSVFYVFMPLASIIDLSVSASSAMLSLFSWIKEQKLIRYSGIGLHAAY